MGAQPYLLILFSWIPDHRNQKFPITAGVAMDIALQEIRNRLEELIHDARMEIDRLTRELAKLENRREDQFERLSREGNDELLQKQLEETDEKISALKKKREEVQKFSTQEIRKLRLGAEKTRDRRVQELKSRYQEMAEERDALREEIIPELEQEIRDLMGKKKNLDGQLLMITSEINELNRFTIEIPNIE